MFSSPRVSFLPHGATGGARCAGSGRCALAVVLLLGLGACQPPPPEEPPVALDSDEAKASYSLGYDVASGMRDRLSTDIDSPAFVAGVEDALNEAERQVSSEEAQRTLAVMAERERANAEEQMAEANEAAEAYLAENATKEGVTALESGLQYEVLTAAPENAPKPSATDTIVAHYHGTLIDGTVFDSSVDRGEPATFPLNRVIPGWTEGLQLMGVGAKWRLFIPPQLGYGPRAAGQIPPNSALIFDVELLEIK